MAQKKTRGPAGMAPKSKKKRPAQEKKVGKRQVGERGRSSPRGGFVEEGLRTLRLGPRASWLAGGSAAAGGAGGRAWREAHLPAPQGLGPIGLRPSPGKRAWRSRGDQGIGEEIQLISNWAVGILVNRAW